MMLRRAPSDVHFNCSSFPPPARAFGTSSPPWGWKGPAPRPPSLQPSAWWGAGAAICSPESGCTATPPPGRAGKPVPKPLQLLYRHPGEGGGRCADAGSSLRQGGSASQAEGESSLLIAELGVQTAGTSSRKWPQASQVTRT